MNGPHSKAEVHHLGVPLTEAHGAVILLHGRGGSAEDILSLAHSLYDPRLAYLAPQAVGNSWYPNSFLAPRASNEPWLTSALSKVQSVVDLVLAAGVPLERIVIGGFSQGACLTTEFAATHPARYAALLAFTGGLIGPPGSDLQHVGDLAGTPALLCSGDPDPHIPWARVEETGKLLTAMGAIVTMRRYPGRPHTVGPDELDHARILLQEAFPK